MNETKADFRSSFREEAEASWIEYLETGLHLTGDEVGAWLATWGTEAETAGPVPHGPTELTRKDTKNTK